MKRLYALTLALAGLLLLIPEQSDAIPAFARKYGFNCNMCHTSFVKLNDFGQRFRDNGYQVPGQEGREKNVFETAPPLSLRTSAGLMLYREDKHLTSGFNYAGLDFLAAGVLHKNISFLLIYTPRVDEPSADYRGTDSSGASQPGALESANIVFSNLVKDVLNVRVGRFEPAYHAFSSKRSYYIMQPYEVYGFSNDSTPSNFVFDDNQFGIEATGHLKAGFNYACGVVNGTGAMPDNNKYKDIYASVQQVLGRGQGQSAGQMAGVFAYYGWQPTVVPGSVVAPTGETAGHNNKSFYRVGGDVSLNWRTFNLRALFMKGLDNKGLHLADLTKDYKFTGGFAEIDWSTLPNNRLLASVLYNWVQPPSSDDARKISAISALVRYYLGDWTAVNVALHAEYTHRQEGKNNPRKTDQLTFLVDFDF